MKTSRRWKFRFSCGKIMMGLVLAALVSSINTVPSFADDHRGGEDRHDNGRYENKGRGHERDRYDRGRRENRSYGYRERVYSPPAIVISPPRPPGIDIFFPPIIFRP